MKRGLSEKQEIMRGKTNIFLKPFMKQILLLFCLSSSTISLLTLKKKKQAPSCSHILLHLSPSPAMFSGDSRRPDAGNSHAMMDLASGDPPLHFYTHFTFVFGEIERDPNWGS